MGSWGSLLPLPPVPGKVWVKKNPEVIIPVRSEVDMTAQQWTDSNFPFYDLPEKVSTHVDTRVWEDKVHKFPSDPSKAVETALVRTVLSHLTEGVDSEVGTPGNAARKVPNYFPDPPIDLPRIVDALATEVKEQRMSGPFLLNTVEGGKENSLMSVPKADGGRRQIGNMSAPHKFSFNDGIKPSTLAAWKVVQTTAKQFSEMIAAAGQNCIISFCDMVAA